MPQYFACKRTFPPRNIQCGWNLWTRPLSCPDDSSGLRQYGLKLNFALSSSPDSGVGHDDLGQNPQIFTRRWEMRSVTKRR